MATRRRAVRRRSLGASLEDPSVRWLSVGRVVGSHGLRGELRVQLYNPDSELLASLAEIALRQGGKLRAYPVVGQRGASKGLLLQLAGVDDVEAARELRGAELCVPRSALPELADGEFYFVDLEGLPAVAPDGSVVGHVERVHEYPAAQVLRVRRREGGVWEVPMREPYLLSVDLAGSRVLVDRLEDLELERDE